MEHFINKITAVLRNEKYAGLLQFFKFGLVGVSNTAISYGIDLLCYYFLLKNLSLSEKAKILATSALAFFISVTNSYYWNNRYVFRSVGNKTINEHIKAYIKTVTCYALTGLIISPVVKLLLNKAGIQYWISSILSLLVAVPLNFFMNKYWAYRKKT